MKRRSIGSIINNLNPEIKERILSTKVNKEILDKFDEEEKREKVSKEENEREASFCDF